MISSVSNFDILSFNDCISFFKSFKLLGQLYKVDIIKDIKKLSFKDMFFNGELIRKNENNLTDDEKIKLCQLVTEAGAEYIKTSTGFGTAGAKPEDIVLFKENIGENVKIKAAGGIRTKEDMEDFIKLGCSRIGTSGAVKALSE